MENQSNLTWFDRIFKPKKMTLANGHSVEAPVSRVPFVIAATLIVVIIAINVTGFDIKIIIQRGNQLGVILGQIFQPKLEYWPKVIGPLLDTIKMSLLGTIIGCLVAAPFAAIASSNINKNRPTLLAVRFLLSLIRSVPTLIIANVCALIFGLGTFAGTIAIGVFTFGIVGKMMFESIETIDMGAFEAMESFGCDKFRAFCAACIPQILPTYLDHCLYCFEMNIRAASILGYVGAGGLGILINERIGWRDYTGLGMVLLALFVLVLCINQLSEYLRSKLS